MAFPVGTRANGAFITASIWNQDLVDNLNALHEASSALGVFNVTDPAYGADPTGATVSTVAFQAAIDASRGTQNPATYLYPCGTVWLPPGDFRIDASLNLHNLEGWRIQGSGLNTRIIWDGDATGPLFSLYASRFGKMSDLVLTIAGGASLEYLVVQEEAPLVDPSGISQTNRFDGVIFEGHGNMLRAVYLKADVTDANNDTTRFSNCGFFNYTDCGVAIQGVNTLMTLFDHCTFGGFRAADYGIKCLTNFGFQTGSFRAFNCTFLGHLVADYYRETSNPVGSTIDMCFSEGSEAFVIDGTAPSGVQSPLTITNSYWDTSQKSGTDPVLLLNYTGPYVIDSLRIATFDTSIPVTCSWRGADGFQGPMSLSVTNCLWDTDLATEADVFPDNMPTTLDITIGRNITTPWDRLDAWRQLMPNAAAGLLAKNAANTGVLSLVTSDASDNVVIGNDTNTDISLKSAAVTATNRGITFPASQVASNDANCLDDYEETQTWTPAFGGSTSQSGQAYAIQEAWSVKIGKRVDFGGRVKLSTLGTITGDVRITGLPYFHGGSTSPASTSPVHIGLFLSLSTAFASLSGFIISGQDWITLIGVPAAGSTSGGNIVQGDLSANTDIFFGGTYYASQ